MDIRVQTSSFRRDGCGNELTQTPQANRVTAFVYDSMDRNLFGEIELAIAPEAAFA
jgi:hypothetical protein